jgi:hypothetical protein
MYKTTEKKILPEYFELILRGEKTFELRLADWDCQPGDVLVLNEINPESMLPTGRSLRRKVGYIVRTKDIDFWSQEDINEHGYQIISLLDEV